MTSRLGSWLGLALSLLLAAAGLLRAQLHDATSAQGHSLAEHHCGTHHHGGAHHHGEIANCEELHLGLELSCCCDHTHAPLGAIEAVPSGDRSRTVAPLAPVALRDWREVDFEIPPRTPRGAVGAIAPVRPPGHLASLRTVVILI